jgi:hypothetical protein
MLVEAGAIRRRGNTIMKSEIERGRHRRAVNVLGRLVFMTLGPLTLSLLFAAYFPPAHAADVTVVGTPGSQPGGPGGDATATTPPNNDSSNTANATGGTGGASGGNGGAGGNAAATAATSTADNAGNGFATATGTGGTGDDCRRSRYSEVCRQPSGPPAKCIGSIAL